MCIVNEVEGYVLHRKSIELFLHSSLVLVFVFFFFFWPLHTTWSSIALDQTSRRLLAGPAGAVHQHWEDGVTSDRLDVINKGSVDPGPRSQALGDMSSMQCHT